jgi:cyclic pyranopterin phosphate synthase
MSDFTHINKKNNPKMVNVSDKKITKRTAIAKATMFLGKEVISHFANDELITKKRTCFSNSNYCRDSSGKKDFRFNSYVSSIIN